jgi:hypothetical protein
MMCRTAVVAVAVLVAGCAAEFLPASVVVNERVIAVTASPPEAVPGQQVTLAPVVVAPTGELTSSPDQFDATWWRCPDSDSDALGDFAQCTVPGDRKDVGTGVPYVDTVPLDLFGAPSVLEDGVADEGPLPSDKLLGAILGYWRVVGLTMTTTDRKVDAFKRIPVYLPIRLADLDPRFADVDSHVNEGGEDTGPNTNPTIAAVLLHEGRPNGGVTTTISAGSTYFLQPVYDEDALQDYVSLKVDLDGLDLSSPDTVRDIPVDELLSRFQKVQRCEIPTFSWFLTHGRVRTDTTLDESVVLRVFDERGIDCPPVEGDERAPEVEYTPPTGEDDDPLPPDGIVRGWVVMRDGRGGAAVRSFDFVFE